MMQKFVIERDIHGASKLTDGELRDVSRKSAEALAAMGPNIQWLESFVAGDKVYCIYVAQNEELIREHARRVGLPANHIAPVHRVLDPSSAG